MKPKRYGVALLLAIFTLWIARPASLGADKPVPAVPMRPWIPEIQLETYTLANGLSVVLHEDHTTPLVSVNIIYNVGSKDETLGRSGFAHMFEHMMFEGSEHNHGSFHWPFYQYMKTSQATTTEDQTVYYETVTRNALERVLWLEADRMGFFLPAVTPEKLRVVRSQVKNERRESVDDLPLGQLDEALRRALYPVDHPYRHSPYGSMADLSAARFADFAPFFDKHYRPNNAFLCVAGDFEPALTKRWIRKFFGHLPGGVPAEPLRPQVPALARGQRIVLFDSVSQAHAELVWPTVPAQHPDEPALDVLASILGGDSRWNRLFRALSYDHQVATATSATHPTQLLSGTFKVDLTARSGQKLDELVRRADVEIERLRNEGPTADEVWRVKCERRKAQISELEGVANKASVLNHYAATHGDPLAYRAVLARIFAVTPEDVKRVAQVYLGPERIELDVFPGLRAARPAQRRPDRRAVDPDLDSTDIPRQDTSDDSGMPQVGPIPRFAPPRLHRRSLSSGLKLIIVERHDLPRVRLRLIVKSGETAVPVDKSGLALITVKLLEEGTTSRSALRLESDLIEIGASLWTEGWLESSMVNLSTVTRHLSRALDLYADAVLNPSFSDQEFLRLKIARMEDLKARGDNAREVAEDVFPRLLYHRDHPYARTSRGTVDSVRSLTREDILAFYRWTFVPANATLVVVGDIVPDEIAAALEARFGSWPQGPVPAPPDLRLMPTPAAGHIVYLVDKPGATQSVLSIGRVGTSIRSVDRHALLILKEKLGSRIESNLCNDKAWSYGFSETFDFRKGAGPLILKGSVDAFETAAALAEVFKEMSDLAGYGAITEENLAENRDSELPGWIDQFETTADVAYQIGFMLSHELPDRYLANELARFKAVTKNHVDRMAERYLSPSRMTILVVGDRSLIEPQLKALRFVKRVRVIDADSNPIPNPAQPDFQRSAAR
jgi:zinc protease